VRRKESTFSKEGDHNPSSSGTVPGSQSSSNPKYIKQQCRWEWVLGMEKTDDTPVSTHGGGELIL
jgi:hypothetical protein